MQELSSRTTVRPSDKSLPWLAAAGISAAALFVASRFAERIRRRPAELRGKIALITGGSRGLGLALAHELGTAGCRLALVARDSDELNTAVTHLREQGFDAAAFPCDVTQQSALDDLVTGVVQHFGRIDLLVNDAGLIKVGPIDSMQEQDFEEAMNLMFWAPVHLTTKVLPHMRKHGSGHIVNISSVGGRVSLPHLLPYSCAKFALTAFSTGLSSELSSEEIPVLTVVPGLLRTGSYLNASFKGNKQGEFGWFSMLGNLPGFSVSAEFAAREVRRAIENRNLTCTISLPAKLLIGAEALLPEANRELMQAAGTYLLPKGDGSKAAEAGKMVNHKFGSVFQALTQLGRMAATRLNER